MTAITPSLFSGQSYQLSSQSGQGGGAGNASGQASISQSLLSALQPQDNTQNASLLSGDTVDLSPQAQQLLAGLGGNTGSGQTSAPGFALTPDQQKKIDDILAKYKDAPFTQATYEQIQGDLKTAGLSPDQLSLQDDMRKFNPTQVLLNALSGTDAPVVNPLADGTEQANANAYMQQVLQQWQGVSTTAGSGADASNGTSS